MIYAYGRVSSKQQNLDRQLIAFRQYAKEECAEDDIKIYVDKQSGKDFERTNYKKLMSIIGPGDVLVVKSIDRFGRNYDEMLREWKVISKDKGCDIVVLDMPLLDTRRDKDLAGTLIADIVLQLLSYVAQQEREFIRQRQAEGIAAAKAMGVKFGRRPMEKPDCYLEVLSKYSSGSISSRKAGEMLGVSHATFLKWAKASN